MSCLPHGTPERASEQKKERKIHQQYTPYWQEKGRHYFWFVNHRTTSLISVYLRFGFVVVVFCCWICYFYTHISETFPHGSTTIFHFVSENLSIVMLVSMISCVNNTNYSLICEDNSSLGYEFCVEFAGAFPCKILFKCYFLFVLFFDMYTSTCRTDMRFHISIIKAEPKKKKKT